MSRERELDGERTQSGGRKQRSRTFSARFRGFLYIIHSLMCVYRAAARPDQTTLNAANATQLRDLLIVSSPRIGSLVPRLLRYSRFPSTRAALIHDVAA